MSLNLPGIRAKARSHGALRGAADSSRFLDPWKSARGTFAGSSSVINHEGQSISSCGQIDPSLTKDRSHAESR